jgi:hypothetical protein
MFAILRAKMQSNVLYYGDNLDMLDGRKFDRPPHTVTFKQAPKATGKGKKTELGLYARRRIRLSQAQE